MSSNPHESRTERLVRIAIVGLCTMAAVWTTAACWTIQRGWQPTSIFAALLPQEAIAMRTTYVVLLLITWALFTAATALELRTLIRREGPVVIEHYSPETHGNLAEMKRMVQHESK